MVQLHFAPRYMVSWTKSPQNDLTSSYNLCRVSSVDNYRGRVEMNGTVCVRGGHLMQSSEPGERLKEAKRSSCCFLTREEWHWGPGLVMGFGRSGWLLRLVISKVFSNLDDSIKMKTTKIIILKNWDRTFRMGRYCTLHQTKRKEMPTDFLGNHETSFQHAASKASVESLPLHDSIITDLFFFYRPPQQDDSAENELQYSAFLRLLSPNS